MKKRLCTAWLAALLATCALGCQTPNGEEMARQLQQGMTMEQVIETFGEPNTAEEAEWKALLNVEDSAVAQLQQQAVLYRDVQYLSERMDLVILFSGDQRDDTVTSFRFVLRSDRDACLAAVRTAASALQAQWGEPERQLGDPQTGTLQDDLLWVKWPSGQLEMYRDANSESYSLVITQHVR